MQKRVTLLMLSAFMMNLNLQAEPIVVTATRINTPAREIGSSITVLSNDEIEARQKTTVLELLRTVPGLDVRQNGGPGGTTSVFIRGSNSNHTLVLIDGIELNDPISPARAANLAHLTTDNIERIEIIRGPQSTLYGSDAMGGVINIMTKKGSGKPSAFVSGEGGSFAFGSVHGGVQGATEKASLSFEASHQNQDGFSAANEERGNTEKDGYQNSTFSGRFNVTPADFLTVNLLSRYYDSQTEIDASGADDPNFIGQEEVFLTSIDADLALFGKLWTQNIKVSHMDLERTFNNKIDAQNPGSSSFSRSFSEMSKLNWQHDVRLHEINIMTLGFEAEREEGESSTFVPQNIRTNGYYAQNQLRLFNSWFTTVGTRVDDHDAFGTEDTYRVTSAYHIHQTHTVLRGTYGTGFKAPSLFQLFSSFGDPDLKPEESVGWDVGIENSFFNKFLNAGVTFFHNDFDNLIEFDSITFTYMNVAESETQGIEAVLGIKPAPKWRIDSIYTYTGTEDNTTGLELVRRPRNKASLSTRYQLNDRTSANCEIQYTGNRYFNDFSVFPANRVKLGGHTVVNVAAATGVYDNIQIFGRIDNVLNKEYEDVLGFGTAGFSAFGGFKIFIP